mgnify:CR=1 FL=1
MTYTSYIMDNYGLVSLMLFEVIIILESVQLHCTNFIKRKEWPWEME